MQGKVVLPVVVLSLVGVVASAFFLVREHTRTYRLVLASGGSTGEYYAFSQAFATAVARNHPTITIDVLETDGSVQNMDLLKSSTAQLALVQSDTPVQSPVRAVALLFPEMFHLLVRTDANINGVVDLRGKRVALMPENSGSYALFWPLVQHYGLTSEDLTPLPMPADQAHAALARGEVDALFRVITLGNPAVAELLQTSRAQLLPIDQVDALRLSLPYLNAQVIPKGTYNGGQPIPPADLPVVGVNALLVAHEDIPTHVVNALTRTLHQNRNELVALYPRAAMIRLDTSGDLGLPLHPGAEAFYTQGEPEFLVEYAEPIGLLLSVAVLSFSSLWQLRSWLLGNQKNRADSYNLEILALIDDIDKARSLEELAALREMLFNILKRVVTDLDVDRITSESFESFTFPWQIANNAIHHQEMLLRQRGEPEKRV
ncbi:TAXI family TRAP transporter solute-binding subunit [Nodosilinea sp. LEGE 07298]|uniref:TAXI family TRAP transporter solute-binding subunit n=1 Tax=Nodosilinea sp. LEGE 07298 TaxID=2777970 RepID=UPI00188123B4|nr:TAXI family TRAP transporter solute-binding subunit [Nodosilinea sp. LEGE 07298]MBE9113311.1 TAXI family TRAP transporter solute-binding subunit [Nodosilinea sp. LEGE 07298]